MNQNTNIEIITEIMQNKLGVPKEILIQGNYDEAITGFLFHFDAVQLTYLFMELENQLGIIICSEDIMNYEFNTINGIANLIAKSHK
ncbi:MAG: hypothetical protein WAX04_05000 [Oscillospiraceae bacterium]